MNPIFAIAFIFLAAAGFLEGSAGARRNFEEKRIEILDPDRYTVEWQADFDAGHVEFTVHARTTGFVGFGLSVSGTMNGADIVIGGVNQADQSVYFADYHGTGNVAPIRDPKQNWELLSGSEVEGNTTLRFRRPLETCDDENDVAITAGTIKLIWAIGASDDTVSGHTPSTRGALAVNMLDPPLPPVDLQKFDVERVRMQYKLLPNDTVYWCTVHKRVTASGGEKSHIVAFKPILETAQALKHVHHFNIYGCRGPNLAELEEYKDKGMNCYGGDYKPLKLCNGNMYAWSFGGRLLVFPDDVGLPWGEEEVEYFLFEAHFDNPEGESGKAIETGVEVYHTKEMRTHEAGLLAIGHGTSPALMVPPATSDWTLVGHCSSGCTGRSITGTGIQIFNANLHAHKSARKMKLRHFRSGQELPWVAKDYTYDFDFQENRPLTEPVEVKPGDHLTIECTFDSSWRNPASAVIGGISTQDEMCMAFMFYYPRVPLEWCFSGYSIPKLLKRLAIEEWQDGADPVIVRPAQWVGLKWTEFLTNNVNWTDTMRAELQKELRFGEQEEYCGSWEEKVIGPAGMLAPGLLDLPPVSYPEFEEEYKENAPECNGGGGSGAGSLVPQIFVVTLTLICVLRLSITLQDR